MNEHRLPGELLQRLEMIRPQILARLDDFARVPEPQYFYELCFCICTPQSRARNAFEVQKILEERDFLHHPFDPAPILRDPRHYIRFHNQKALNLLRAREKFPELRNVLRSDISPRDKRSWLVVNIRGMGMKEASHFLRNIGYRELAILDRHILKHLGNLGAYERIPDVGTIPRYLAAERIFLDFSFAVGVPVDELDLLFWSLEAGEILK